MDQPLFIGIKRKGHDFMHNLCSMPYTKYVCLKIYQGKRSNFYVLKYPYFDSIFSFVEKQFIDMAYLALVSIYKSILAGLPTKICFFFLQNLKAKKGKDAPKTDGTTKVKSSKQVN